ncbi:MAG: winged helix-turn-helix domain-containing protein [Alphaproteobacteria bacterium]|nr:winged helix-turn-helix domain-containing protein [Alphaproteobacteria bacterium]
MPQSNMLTIMLHIQNIVLQQALRELLPQAGILLAKDEKEAEAILYTSPYTGGGLPSLDFDTFPRPFKLSDLLGRLKNLPYSQAITFSDFVLNLREKALFNPKTQQEQRLTEKECQLLRLFCLNKGQDLSKEKLMREVWGYHPDAETHTLETHIYRLRQKLEEDPNIPKILLNGKTGYFIK